MRIGGLVFLPFAVAPAGYIMGRKNGKARDVLLVAFTFAELLLSLTLFGSGESFSVSGILVSGLFFKADGFRTVYGMITAFMWAMSSLFSLSYFKNEQEGLNHYDFFLLLTLGATQGVMFSADLMTAFVFFEILSFTSFTWVIHEETGEAIRAAKTYLAIAVIGGLLLFMGLLLLKETTGTLTFALLRAQADEARRLGNGGSLFTAGVLILLGFGAKAGMFPLHIWLPKAHPVAPAPASALLSGILTKVGIYGILFTTVNVFFTSVSFGVLILVLGLTTMFLGALLALFSINLKRTLACSSMSQIGFILTGIGMAVLLNAAGSEEESLTALWGTLLHMVNHSLLKLVLFLAAGVVAMNLHALDLNRIRGWGRNKPLLKIPFALGGLGISGFPLFNGYISKTLLHESLVAGAEAYRAYDGLLRTAEWIFLISGGLTFAYMLKLYMAVFVAEPLWDPRAERAADNRSNTESRTAERSRGDADGLEITKARRNRPYMDAASVVAVFLPSFLFILLGQPAVMKKLATIMTGKKALSGFSAFSAENLTGSFISLLIGAAVYLFFVRKILMRNGSYRDLWPAGLDLEDLVYRPLLLNILPAILGAIASVFGENKLLKPFCRALLSVYRMLARAFGENRILIPLAGTVFYLTAACGKLLSLSTDRAIAWLRRTVFREVAVRGDRQPAAGRIRRLTQATAAALGQVSATFSFALFMTCLGLLVILGAFVLLLFL